MKGNLLIKSGQVWNSSCNLLKNNDILVVDGKIVEIGEKLSIRDNIQIEDVKGKMVLPGAIDPHVHFNDPGFTKKEDFFKGTSAAAKGGITTVIDMPCTSIPPVTCFSNLMEKLEVVKEKAVVDFAFFGGVSDNSFELYNRNMEELADYIAGFKVYSISGMSTFESLNELQLKKIIEKAAILGKVVLLHAEDKNYIEKRAKEVKVNHDSPYSYYLSRDEFAETLAVEKALKAASKYSKYLHIVHVGTGKVVKLLEKSEATGETAPHYLAFDCKDFETIGASLKVNPPVKSPINKEKLWKGLNDGTLKFVASDHAPCKKSDKETGSIITAYSGIPGCETLVPYLFSEGYLKGRITLETFVAITSKNAAKRYSLSDRKGSIEVGKDGDFMVIDQSSTFKVDENKLYSKGKTTPFHNMEFQGKVEKTIVRGTVVYSDEQGIEVEKGFGNFITFKRI